jgi:ATP-binding cassette subfamily B protein RaxB
MQSVKLFNREGEREALWLGRYAAAANAGIRVGRLRIAFRTANDAVFGLENILTVYLAVRLVLDGSMSVGMVFAFMSYKQHFIEKLVALVEKALELKVLDLHLERLADIALARPEAGHDRPLAQPVPAAGRIELRGVAFRYADGEPFVLSGQDLTIEAGEYVTIAGPSGGGKTTLLKIMLGLLEPTSGEVLVDGVPLPVYGARAWREQVAAVMQDDQLLSGTIADNICFFDQCSDPDWMVQCARMSAVHDDIMSMPMGYNTLVGDMGSSLSGGQKQRVLLARALYRRPRVLFLDEGTAHLDVETERQINATLRHLEITRVSIAHRPETIRAADRVLMIGARNGYPTASPR